MTKNKQPSTNTQSSIQKDIKSDPKTEKDDKAEEIGGRKGLDPTRYGDWEKDGKCVDF